MHLIEKSQGERATLIGSPALLVDSGHKDSAKAHQINHLDLLLPSMLGLSHINAWKDQQAAVKESTSVFCNLYKLGPEIYALN